MKTTDRCIEELKLAGLFDKDSDYEGMIGEAVKELLKVFQKQGHSGASAPHVANIFNRLIQGKNLTPLKGTPDEWVEVSENLFQNKRNSAVFAESNTGEKAYYIDGKVFKDKNGSAWTSKKSRVSLKFPCYPKTIYIRNNWWGKVKYFLKH